MRLLVFVLAAFLFWQNPARASIRVPQGCLVSALEFQCASTAAKGLRKHTWSRLLHVSFGTRRGHAYCVYTLRTGDVFAYDMHRGSKSLFTRSRDLASLKAGIRRYDRRILAVNFLD